MDEFEDQVKVELYNNSIYIEWALKGYGFGTIRLDYNHHQNKWKSDTECLSEETLEKILHIAAPKLAKLLTDLDK